MSAARPSEGARAEAAGGGRPPLAAHRQRGLTLIELMVALSVFAVLGVLSYRALSEVANSHTRLEASFERWRAINRSIQRIDTDLLQAVSTTGRNAGQPGADGATPGGTPAPTVRSTTAAPMLLTRTASGGPEFQFLRLDDTRGVRRVGYRLVDGRLEWLRWSGRDAIGDPDVEPLLDKVRGVRWRFLLNNNRLDAWPPGDTRATLPDAVILELDLEGTGVLTRVIALR